MSGSLGCWAGVSSGGSALPQGDMAGLLSDAFALLAFEGTVDVTAVLQLAA